MIFAYIAVFFIILFGLLISIFHGNNKKIGGYEQFSRKYYLSKEAQEALAEIVDDEYNVIELKDIDQSIKYQSGIRPNNILHIGQLKLMLSELEFLTDYYHKSKLQSLFIYVGSAPGNHMSFISDLFPELKFLLIDPNELNVLFKDADQFNKKYQDLFLYFKYQTSKESKIINFYNNEKIEKTEKTKKTAQTLDFQKMIEVIRDTNYKFYIYEDLFTDEFSLADFSEFNLYFCSDIRTNTGTTDFSSMPNDLDILYNNAQQYFWIKNLKPSYSLLKFRCPYFSDHLFLKKDTDKVAELPIFEKVKDDIDFLDDYRKKIIKYLKPEHIYLQAFPGISSTEVRLVISKKTIIDQIWESFDPKEYEDKLFYYNKFIRPFCFHANNSEYFDKKIGIDGCGDCNIMIHIFKKYLENNSKEKNHVKKIKEMTNEILKIIGKSLIQKNNKHGAFFTPYNVQLLVNNHYFS